MASRQRRKAPPDPRAEWLTGLPESFEGCRDLGHTWRPHSGGWSRELNGWLRVLACARCATERHQTINGLGHVTSNRYRYADGYQAPKGVDPISRDEIRLASITRQFGSR